MHMWTVYMITEQWWLVSVLMKNYYDLIHKSRAVCFLVKAHAQIMQTLEILQVCTPLTTTHHFLAAQLQISESLLPPMVGCGITLEFGTASNTCK